MRQLFLILLLAVLPLQYAWSAAAAYCGHEQGKTQHFGHHAHQHASERSDGDDGGDGHGQPSKAKPHPDCAVCQFAGQASMPALLAALPDALRAAYPPPADPFFTSYIADGPKRPDWRSAA